MWRRPFGDWATLAADPTLTFYASVDLRSGDAVVRVLKDDSEVARLPSLRGHFSFAPVWFSPDGQYLHAHLEAPGVTSESVVWHLGRKQIVFRQAVRGYASAFHPDGRAFLFAPVGEGVIAWDLVEGRERSRLPLAFKHPTAFAIDPSGTRLAANDEQQRTVRVLDIDSGREVDSWTEAAGRNMLAWSGDGRLLAAGDFTGTVSVRDVANRRLSSVLEGHSSAVVVGQFSSRGDLLATSGWDLSLRLWDASTGEPLLASLKGGLLGFSRDGRHLAYQDGTDLRYCEVVNGCELTVLNPAGIGNRAEIAPKGDYVSAARFSPDNRILAIATLQGVHLYDASSGRELAMLGAGECHAILFDREGRNLFCHGRRGLQRWPIALDPGAGPGALRVGPPEVLREMWGNPDWYHIAWLPDGRTMAALDNHRKRVVLIDTTEHRPHRGPDRQLTGPDLGRLVTLSVSPDGRWAAAGGWREGSIRVWDLSTDRLAQTLRPSDGESSNFVAFSPDGRLNPPPPSSATGYYAWDPTGWGRSRFLTEWADGRGGEPIFSDDGSTAALYASREQVRLVDAVTGHTIVHLAAPEPLDAVPLAFSPDGTRLVARTARKTAVLWDLRLVREQLKECGLDWDRPSYPSPSGGGSIPSIRAVGTTSDEATSLAHLDARIADDPEDGDALNRRGQILASRRRYAEAIADLERSRTLMPRAEVDDYHLATALNDFAWDLAAGPIERRDPARAVALASRAVELGANNDVALNTLGVALYRADRFGEAIPFLERSLNESRDDLDGYDLLFLAMAHHRIGHSAEALALMRRETEWRSSGRRLRLDDIQALKEIRAEARAILARPAYELPADVFAHPRSR